MCKNFLLACLMLCLSVVARAEMCLGFNLGQETKQAVINTLKNQEAEFQDLKEKGPEGLSFIKITQLASLEKWGTLKEAIFMFTPNNVLFAMDIHYYDNGTTFANLKNQLERKYGPPKDKHSPNGQAYVYEPSGVPDFGVELMRNETASDQKLTSVMYLNKAIFSQIEKDAKKASKK